MNCLAVWYKRKPLAPKKKLDVELHINLWQLKKKDKKEKKASKNFLDIGIKIFEPSNVDNIRIFLPFKVKKDEIEDIGHFFEGNNKLVAAIFNDEFQAQPIQVQSKTLQVINGNNNIQFYIYMIDDKNDVRMLKKNYGGSVIDIKLNSAAKYKPLYYRIRINSDNLEEFYTQYKPQSQWLDSHSTTTELIDFRVNEKRNLDRTLLEDMRNSGEVFFKKVEYFVMREFKYDYVSSHKEMLRSRRLEEDLWDSYVGEDCECGKIIAYHWSWDEKPGFNAFVKYRFLSSDKKTRLRFCFFLIVIALIGGVLASLLIKLIDMW
jgi:hypothetical protein